MKKKNLFNVVLLLVATVFVTSCGFITDTSFKVTYNGDTVKNTGVTVVSSGGDVKVEFYKAEQIFPDNVRYTAIEPVEGESDYIVFSFESEDHIIYSSDGVFEASWFSVTRKGKHLYFKLKENLDINQRHLTVLVNTTGIGGALVNIYQDGI